MKQNGSKKNYNNTRKRGVKRGGFFRKHTHRNYHPVRKTHRKYIHFFPKYLGKPNTSVKEKLFLFFANWCGHCNTMREGWDNFAKWMSTTHPNIFVKDIESENSERDKIQKEHNITVTGFPTIAFVNKHKHVKYFEGMERTEENFRKWISDLVK